MFICGSSPKERKSSEEPERNTGSNSQRESGAAVTIFMQLRIFYFASSSGLDHGYITG